MNDFDSYFAQIAGDSSATRPHDWQRFLAEAMTPRRQLVRIPTGMGRTLGALAAWLRNRKQLGDPRWPRRLVWCLPMRALVEQTDAVVRDALSQLGCLCEGNGDHAGGPDPSGDWHLYPEECTVLIGTQDMLLSRALNRGYASGRARWPLEFGLLSHDALWGLDEV